MISRGLNKALLYTLGRPFPTPTDAIAVRGDAVVPLLMGTTMHISLASGGHWYGHGFNHRQPYPLNAEPVVNPHFAVNNIQSPIWIASEGFAILANTVAPLDVRLNSEASGFLSISCPSKDVTIEIFAGPTLPEAHQKLLKRLHWPPPSPEKSLFGDSIFCTWTQYPRAISQDRILSMAHAIREHEYPCSVLTIDDRWESVFGELRFSRNFPDPEMLIQDLHSLGFRVLLWVTPFVNCEAATFPFLAEKGWLAPRKEGGGPSLFQWWGGRAGIVDLSNPEARDWYRDQLLRLKNEVGIDGFKIDGGDAKYQPLPEETAWNHPAGASGYVDLLLALFEEVAPGFCESRTGWLSQRRNIIWRQGGKDSHWGVDNGLQAMIHLSQHLGLLGYDVLIPDMIPGRVQTLVSDLPLPSDELFIRWTEATAVMPMMQYSYFPWNYAATTATIAQRYAQLHKALEDYLHRHASNRSIPLLRPLWYDAPECAEFYAAGDTFLLGPDLLAAPVTRQGITQRDLLLPPGQWRDLWTGKTFEGGRITGHPAPCPGIPLFLRAEQTELFGTLHAILKTMPAAPLPTGTTATYACGLDRDLSVTG